MSTCRSCGATIEFAMTRKGRRMPVDSAPDPAGLWTIDEDGVLQEATLGTPAEERRTSHFVTCPKGRQWSDKRKRGAA